MKLVIVESPAKAKTIKKYLGRGYEVVASMGHVRDLPASKLGIDIENNFEPQYINIRGKGDLIKSLKKSAKDASTVYLATDPDREGEAISWHLAHILGLDPTAPNRVTFNEITKTGIKSGMAAPRSINQDLVDAQQARRVLDRIVGYQISPFLWKKVKRGLSAGRVQSVAVKLIADREAEIENFDTEEYWTIDAKMLTAHARKAFPAKLTQIDGKKAELKNEEDAKKILARIGNGPFTVAGLKKGERKKAPYPPFTTSTLQQDASIKLGFQSKRTMKVAQELYEGVDIKGMGAVGLITYMRTDSLRISDEAWNQANEFIKEKYGAEYLPQSRRVYKSRQNTQDAHEAVRPTMPSLSPDEIKESLTPEQYKLYKLIWSRFIASQMAGAVYNTVSADITAAGCLFKSSGYTVKFDGFTAVYKDSKEDKGEDETEGALPAMAEGDILTAKEILPNQHFTQPPARYTEASLIKALEENGIGRPSTYAPTITTILARGYVEREGKSLKPTYLGDVTNKFLQGLFSDIINVKFTAEMEEKLDTIELEHRSWKEVLAEFYGPFSESLKEAEKTIDGTKVEIPAEETDVICEKCGRHMVVKISRYGKFLACPGFPECRNTKQIVYETPGICPKCGGKILEKKSKKGKKYFACEKAPECDFMTWDVPVKEVCPQCGCTLYRKGWKPGRLVCLKEGCGYERPLKPGEKTDEE